MRSRNRQFTQSGIISKPAHPICIVRSLLFLVIIRGVIVCRNFFCRQHRQNKSCCHYGNGSPFFHNVLSPFLPFTNQINQLFCFLNRTTDEQPHGFRPSISSVLLIVAQYHYSPSLVNISRQKISILFIFLQYPYIHKKLISSEIS